MEVNLSTRLTIARKGQVLPHLVWLCRQTTPRSSAAGSVLELSRVCTNVRSPSCSTGPGPSG